MVEQVVGLRFVVDGEREATTALKNFNAQQEKLTNNIKAGAGIASRLEADIKKLASAYNSGVIGQKAYEASLTNITRAYKALNEGVKGQSMSIQKATADVRKVVSALEQEKKAVEDLEMARKKAETGFALAMQRHKEEVATANEAARAAAAQQAEIIKLERVYNQTAAAARVYEQAVENLTRAEKLGVITADQKAKELLQLNNAYNQIGGNTRNATNFINQFGDVTRVAGIKTNRFGMVAQQVGYQVGDFFVQVQSGTNVFVAFGQQATQLAGLLPGLAGAIVGIGISVTTAILATFSRASEATKTLDESLSDLESASESVRTSLDRLKDPDLAETFGNMTDDIRSMTSAMVQLDQAAELRSLIAALDALEKKANATFLDIAKNALIPFQEIKSIEQINQEAFDKLGLQLGKNGREAYKKYIEGIQAAAQSGNVELTVGLLDDFIQDATDAGTAVDKITDAGILLLQSFRTAALQVAQTRAQLNGSADEAERLKKNAKTIAEGTEALETLWGNVKSRISESVEEASEQAKTIRQATTALEQEAALIQAISRYGEESAEVTSLRRQYAMQAAEALIEENNASGTLADNYRNAAAAAFDAAEAAKQIDRNQKALGDGVTALETIWKNIKDRVAEAADEYGKIAEKGNDIVAAYEREAELNRAILESGKDSAEVAAIKKQHYMDGVEALIRQMQAGDELAKKIRESAEAAYDTGVAVENAGDKTSDTADEAERLANELARAAAVAMNINVPGAEKLAALNAELNAYNRGLSETQVRVQSAAREAELRARAAGIDSPAELAFRAAEAARIEQETINSENALKAYTETSNGASKSTRKLKEEMSAAEKAAKEYADTMNGYVVGAVDGVADAFGDFVMRGFKDFKGFVSSVLGSFKNMIAQMIAYAARNQIMIGLGLGGASIGGTVANAAGSALGGGVLIGSIGSLVGAGGFLSGVAGGAGAALGLGGYTSAGIFNVGANAAVASAATGASAFATTIGAALPLVAGAIAIFSFFKKKVEVLDAGLDVAINDLEAVTQTFQRVKTTRFFGLSRKVSTQLGEAPEELQNTVQNSILGIANSIGQLADVIGLGEEAFTKFSYEFRVSLKDLTEEQQLAAIQEELAKFGDALAGSVTRIRVYNREGESYMQTLERLATAVGVARTAFDAFGAQLFDLGRIAETLGAFNIADLAVRMTEAAGGVEAFAQASNSYFENFFSDAEQLEYKTRKVREAFQELGVEMPNTREQFRELVESMTRELELRTMSKGALREVANEKFTTYLDTVGTGRGASQAAYAEYKVVDDILNEMFEGVNVAIAEELSATLGSIIALAPAFADVTQTVDDLSEAIDGLDDAALRQAESLRERLMRLQGDTEGLRDMERATMLSPENLALLNEIFALEDSIAAAEEMNRIREEGEGIERRILELQGDTARIRELELAALDESNRALQEQVYALEDQAEAAREAARIASERQGLERRLLEVHGDTAAIRALELAALDESNRSILERIYALQDQAEAEALAAAEAEARAAAERAIMDERASLERQYYELIGDTAAIREIELAALDESNRSRQEYIYFLQDMAKKEQEAKAAAEARAAAERAILTERAGLERQYYELIGDTARIREMELAGLDESNRSRLEFIYFLQDLAAAEQEAKAAIEARAAAERAIMDERAGLERRYYELIGDTDKLREMELAGLDESNRSRLEFIYFLEDLNAASEEAKRIAAERAEEEKRIAEEGRSIAQQGIDLERQLLLLQGEYSAAREIELAQRQAELILIDEQNRAKMEENFALQDAIRVQEEANRLRDEERALLIELYTLQGDIDAARQIELMIREEELAALDASNVATQERINALKDEIAAIKGVTEAIDAMAQSSQAISQRNSILQRIYSAVDDVPALREMEMADILEENKPLQDVLYRVEDDIKRQQKLIAAAEEARQKALEEQRKMEQVASERENLIAEALRLQGNLDKIREYELSLMDPLNRGMQEFIYKLEDARDVLNSIKEIDFATKLDYDRAVARARAMLAAPLPELPPIPEITIPEVPTLRLPNVRGWISEALGGNTAGVPGFAEGGYHSGGLRLVGENGPELEVTGPSRIYSAKQTSDMLGGNEELKREVEDLKMLTVQNAKYIKRTYDIYRKWDVDGLPSERT